ERRAERNGVGFRGADARPPRASLLERTPEQEPWRACSRPLRLAYVTAQGTALPCCIAPFTDAPFEIIRLGNYLEDGVAAEWRGWFFRCSPSRPVRCRRIGSAVTWDARRSRGWQSPPRTCSRHSANGRSWPTFTPRRWLPRSCS